MRDMPRPQRRSIRLRSHDYSEPGEYFVTLCTQEMVAVFGHVTEEAVYLSDAGRMVDRWWQELPAKFPTLDLGPYVVMPNHVHGILLLNPSESEGTEEGCLPTLGRIVQWLKTMATNEYIRAVREGRWPPFRKRLWQRNYWEHIIRDDRDLAEIEEYIRLNPAEWQWDRDNRAAIARLLRRS